MLYSMPPHCKALCYTPPHTNHRKNTVSFACKNTQRPLHVCLIDVILIIWPFFLLLRLSTRGRISNAHHRNNQYVYMYGNATLECTNNLSCSVLATPTLATSRARASYKPTSPFARACALVLVADRRSRQQHTILSVPLRTPWPPPTHEWTDAT
jgi:hypothetical protein